MTLENNLDQTPDLEKIKKAVKIKTDAIALISEDIISMGEELKSSATRNKEKILETINSQNNKKIRTLEPNISQKSIKNANTYINSNKSMERILREIFEEGKSPKKDELLTESGKEYANNSFVNIILNPLSAFLEHYSNKKAANQIPIERKKTIANKHQVDIELFKNFCEHKTSNSKYFNWREHDIKNTDYKNKGKVLGAYCDLLIEKFDKSILNLEESKETSTYGQIFDKGIAGYLSSKKSIKEIMNKSITSNLTLKEIIDNHPNKGSRGTYTTAIRKQGRTFLNELYKNKALEVPEDTKNIVLEKYNLTNNEKHLEFLLPHLAEIGETERITALTLKKDIKNEYSIELSTDKINDLYLACAETAFRISNLY